MADRLARKAPEARHLGRQSGDRTCAHYELKLVMDTALLIQRIHLACRSESWNGAG